MRSGCVRVQPLYTCLGQPSVQPSPSVHSRPMCARRSATRSASRICFWDVVAVKLAAASAPQFECTRTPSPQPHRSDTYHMIICTYMECVCCVVCLAVCVCNYVRAQQAARDRDDDDDVSSLHISRTRSQVHCPRPTLQYSRSFHVRACDAYSYSYS